MPWNLRRDHDDRQPNWAKEYWSITISPEIRTSPRICQMSLEITGNVTPTIEGRFRGSKKIPPVTPRSSCIAVIKVTGNSPSRLPLSGFSPFRATSTLSMLLSIIRCASLAKNYKKPVRGSLHTSRGLPPRSAATCTHYWKSRRAGGCRTGGNYCHPKHSICPSGPPDPRPSAFRPGISPVALHGSRVLRVRWSPVTGVGRCRCCQRPDQEGPHNQTVGSCGAGT